MKELFDAARLQWLLWKLAIARAVLYSVSTLISSFMTANASIVWGSLDTWERFLIVLGCVGGWCTTMIAFLDKTSAQISKGQIPGGQTGDTTISHKNLTP